MKRIDLKPGQKILIYGATGAIGTAMVQLAKSLGAAVTAVVATRHLELAKSLGADHAKRGALDVVGDHTEQPGCHSSAGASTGLSAS